MNTVTMIEQVCCSCGTRFQMDEALNELRKQDGSSFFCPNGHAQKYVDSIVGKCQNLETKNRELQEEIQGLGVEIRRLKCELLAKQKEEKHSILKWIS